MSRYSWSTSPSGPPGAAGFQCAAQGGQLGRRAHQEDVAALAAAGALGHQGLASAAGHPAIFPGLDRLGQGFKVHGGRVGQVQGGEEPVVAHLAVLGELDPGPGEVGFGVAAHQFVEVRAGRLGQEHGPGPGDGLFVALVQGTLRGEQEVYVPLQQGMIADQRHWGIFPSTWGW